MKKDKAKSTGIPALLRRKCGRPVEKDLHRTLPQLHKEIIMPRGFSKGRGSRRGRSSTGGNRSSRQKGQVKNGKSVQYSIEGADGKTKYIGTTNNPSRRAGQHKKSGKLGSGDRLVVETRPTSRSKVERVEKAKLKSFRQNNGRNPQHNVTNDGKYHPR